MSLADAPRLATPYLEADLPQAADASAGAQSLLHLAPPPPNYPARVGAIVVYLALLGLFVTVGFKTADTPIEEQPVVELAPIPVEEPPPEDTPPPPEAMDIPDLPPPPAFDPIAPVDDVKPVEKPKPQPKIEKLKPRAETPPAREAKPAKGAPKPAAVPAARAPAAPAGATISEAANHYHACLQRAAASMEPPVGGRVTYHATVSATGAITSFSITSSSNPSLASLAQRLGARCGSVPAPGRAGSLTGGISFSGP